MLGISGFLLLAVGCGRSGPELAQVSGKVTLDGQPVAHAHLTFKPPATGSGSTAYGVTDSNGYYSLQYSRDANGALPGPYEVVIEPPPKLSKSEIAELKAAGENVPETNINLPARYGKPGELTAEVKSGSNTIDFPLVSKSP